MARFLQIVLVVVLVGACTAAELPQRFRNVRTNRFFARQEAVADNAPPAPAPYPPAGIKPEVSFELPTETTTVQPDNTYLPPDNTYGPPEAPVEPEVVTEVPEIVLVDDDDDTDSVISVAVSYDQDNLITPEEPQRLVFGQRTRTRPSSQRFRAAEPIFFDDGSFAYSRQL